MEIDEFLFNAELEDIIEELRRQLHNNGINLLQKPPKKSGLGSKESLQIQCPYHGDGQERKPSAGIRKSDGLFHCFACGQVHTLPEVISFCFGHEEDIIGSWGWKWLVRNFATVRLEERKDVDLDLDRTYNRRDTRNFVSAEELDSYRYYHPYWKKRGITNEDIIELFDLGYDKKTHCITFPIRDKDGNCLFVARRSVRTKYFNYPAGAEKPLYGLYEIYQLEQFPKEIIICESMIDALTCWQFGRVAVALNGLGNALQFEQLRKLPIRKYILATDNDEAGLRARDTLKKNLPNKIITEFVFPEGKKDINDLNLLEFRDLAEIF